MRQSGWTNWPESMKMENNMDKTVCDIGIEWKNWDLTIAYITKTYVAWFATLIWANNMKLLILKQI